MNVNVIILFFLEGVLAHPLLLEQRYTKFGVFPNLFHHFWNIYYFNVIKVNEGA